MPHSYDLSPWKPAPYNNSVFLSDTAIAMTLADPGLSGAIGSVSITTHPTGSSSATLAASGATITFTPDVAGAYVLSIAVGSMTLTYNFFVWSSSVVTSLAKTATGVTRGPNDVRLILQAASRDLTASLVNSWVGGTYPPAPFRLTSYGG